MNNEPESLDEQEDLWYPKEGDFFTLENSPEPFRKRVYRVTRAKNGFVSYQQPDEESKFIHTSSLRELRRAGMARHLPKLAETLRDRGYFTAGDVANDNTSPKAATKASVDTIIEELLKNPRRYATGSEDYTHGYVDALMDVFKRLH